MAGEFMTVNKKITSALWLILTLSGCGGDPGAVGIFQRQEHPTEGRYQVKLQPLNQNLLDDDFQGEGHFFAIGDEFRAFMRVQAAPPGLHLQHVHSGRACPSLAADANDDGVIDVLEARAVSGRVLIPLNGSLESQAEGEGNYPAGVNYEYEQSASLSRMLGDLRGHQSVSPEGMTKLDTDEELHLDGRVVIIYGVGTTTILPDTAQTIEGRPAHETLPIACGVIERIDIQSPAEEEADPTGRGHLPSPRTTNPEGEQEGAGTLDRIGDEIEQVLN
jgi:hypothetical protein